MTLVSLGLFMAASGKTKINPEAEHSVHAYWHYIVYAAETIIFFLAGVIVGVKCLNDETGYVVANDYLKLLGIYLCMSVGRGIVIGLAFPFLRKLGYGMNWKELLVVIYGGLRGAVGISFAMIVAHDEDFPAKFRDIFFFHMSGCAVLTLLINATTSGFLIDKFGITSRHRMKDQIFTTLLENMIEDIDEKCEKMESNKYLEVADWDKAKKVVGIDEYR